MTAEELKNIVEHLKLEYVDDDSRMQFYALHAWCSIAVSLERIEQRMHRMNVMQGVTLTDEQLQRSVKALDLE